MTADFYAHVGEELQQDAAEKINGLLTGLLTAADKKKNPADAAGRA